MRWVKQGKGLMLIKKGKDQKKNPEKVKNLTVLSSGLSIFHLSHLCTSLTDILCSGLAGSCTCNFDDDDDNV